jgi:hypothetical protein
VRREEETGGEEGRGEQRRGEQRRGEERRAEKRRGVMARGFGPWGRGGGLGWGRRCKRGDPVVTCSCVIAVFSRISIHVSSLTELLSNAERHKRERGLLHTRADI